MLANEKLLVSQHSSTPSALELEAIQEPNLLSTNEPTLASWRGHCHHRPRPCLDTNINAGLGSSLENDEASADEQLRFGRVQGATRSLT